MRQHPPDPPTSHQEHPIRMTNARARVGTGIVAVILGSACTPPQSRPAVEPVESTVATAPAPARRYVEADVRFMQHMIEHHDQALVMTALVPDRAASETVRLMADRIAVSQQDEIRRMRRWLVERGEEVPAVGQAHSAHAASPQQRAMPGMLTPDELQRLSASKGAGFDRLFLEFMIRHHEGALVMVAELFAAPGAGEELDIFMFASDVDADQRAEIRRMRLLLGQLPVRQPPD